jgi:hypothetical protein
MTNAHSKMGQMAVCCQNLPLGALSSHSAPSVLIGALFKMFGLLLNTPRIFLPVTVCKCVNFIYVSLGNGTFVVSL